jgi:hypothetical protein
LKLDFQYVLRCEFLQFSTIDIGETSKGLELGVSGSSCYNCLYVGACTDSGFVLIHLNVIQSNAETA